MGPNGENVAVMGNNKKNSGFFKAKPGPTLPTVKSLVKIVAAF